MTSHLSNEISSHSLNQIMFFLLNYNRREDIINLSSHHRNVCNCCHQCYFIFVFVYFPPILFVILICFVDCIFPSSLPFFFPPLPVHPLYLRHFLLRFNTSFSPSALYLFSKSFGSTHFCIGIRILFFKKSISLLLSLGYAFFDRIFLPNDLVDHSG